MRFKIQFKLMKWKRKHGKKKKQLLNSIYSKLWTTKCDFFLLENNQITAKKKFLSITRWTRKKTKYLPTLQLVESWSHFYGHNYKLNKVVSVFSTFFFFLSTKTWEFRWWEVELDIHTLHGQDESSDNRVLWFFVSPIIFCFDMRLFWKKKLMLNQW